MSGTAFGSSRVEALSLGDRVATDRGRLGKAVVKGGSSRLESRSGKT